MFISVGYVLTMYVICAYFCMLCICIHYKCYVFILKSLLLFCTMYVFSVGYELILCLFCMLCFNSVGYILIMQAIYISVEYVFVFILYALCLFCVQGICSVVYDLLCRLCVFL